MKYTLHIEQDNDPQSPREWDNLGTIAAFNRRYNFDEANISVEEAQEIAKSKDYVSLPVYLYDHSGLSVSTTGFSCRWDSGQLGIIYVSKEKVCKEYGWKILTKERREKIESYLNGEIKELDQYLAGDVYGYVIKDENGNVAESCWGFYGEDYCKEEGAAMLKHRIEEDERIEHLAKVQAVKEKIEKEIALDAAYTGL